MAENLNNKIDIILEKYNNPEESLIAVLQDVQAIAGYISQPAVEYITEKTGIPSSRIMGVASFYAGFRLKPVGKYRIMVCMGTACHVNGSERISAAITQYLGIENGQTTADGLFTLEHVACLGCCSLAPVIMINGEAYGNLTPDSVVAVLDEIRRKEGVL